jgi:hypothetical protein
MKRVEVAIVQSLTTCDALTELGIWDCSLSACSLRRYVCTSLLSLIPSLTVGAVDTVRRRRVRFASISRRCDDSDDNSLRPRTSASSQRGRPSC